MTTVQNDPDVDLTIPPLRVLRYDAPVQLYAEIPKISAFTKHVPQEDEDNFSYLDRLRRSTTPEDAVTFAAFATEPRSSISWGVQSVRAVVPDPNPDDLQLLSWISQWLEHPSDETRWRTMQVAMFAPRRSAFVYLGLAVGWSGGALAPNDHSAPPSWRAPRAVNAAVLTAIAKAGATNRSVNLARVLDLASNMFRVY